MPLILLFTALHYPMLPGAFRTITLYVKLFDSISAGPQRYVLSPQTKLVVRNFPSRRHAQVGLLSESPDSGDAIGGSTL